MVCPAGDTADTTRTAHWGTTVEHPGRVPAQGLWISQGGYWWGQGQLDRRIPLQWYGLKLLPSHSGGCCRFQLCMARLSAVALFYVYVQASTGVQHPDFCRPCTSSCILDVLTIVSRAQPASTVFMILLEASAASLFWSMAAHGHASTCTGSAIPLTQNSHGAGSGSGSSRNLAETSTSPRELGLNFSGHMP